MGGIVCFVHRNAVLRFQSVPTNPSLTAEFDVQIRQLYNAPGIAESLASDTTRTMEACLILAKSSFTHTDRVNLYEIIEDLYEGYPGT